ncbi:MAG: AfsR/SARP family transcriptional regulator, partial [Acidimicrobiales bacterium]
MVVDLRQTPTPPDPTVGTSSPAVTPPATGGSTVPITEAPVPTRTLSTVRPALAEPYVTILGQVDLHCEFRPDRRVVRELAVYLALHRDRPRSAEELVAILWPAGDDFTNERDPDAVHQTASRLRRCLGPDALPDATTSGGYLLSDAITSDWEAFQSLVAVAPAEDDAVAI